MKTGYKNHSIFDRELKFVRSISVNLGKWKKANVSQRQEQYFNAMKNRFLILHNVFRVDERFWQLIFDLKIEPEHKDIFFKMAKSIKPKEYDYSEYGNRGERFPTHRFSGIR